MIRKIEKSDKKIYTAFAEAFYHSNAVDHAVPESHYTVTFDELMSSDRYAEGYILEYNGKPVGYALTAKTFSQEAGGMVVWIEELFVLPEYRGKGLGTEFFEFVKKHIEPDAARIRLEIEPDNTDAIRLYERMGFKTLPYRQMIKELH